MSTQAPRATATPAPPDVTIDLTADSDSDDTSTDSESSLPSQASSQPPQRRSRHLVVGSWVARAHEQHLAQQQQEHARIRQEAARRQRETVQRQQEQHTRAPPFGQRPQTPEVIDLADTDESELDRGDFEISVDADTHEPESTFSPSASPEVEFVEERRVAHAQRQDAAAQTNFGLNGPRRFIPDLLRRGTHFMFENMHHIRPGHGERILNGFDVVPPRVNDGRLGNDGGDAFIINMDYRQPAFSLGPIDVFDRSSETPQVVPEPYKGPPAAKEGFIRTFGEEDIILCPMCGDELATGKGDIKQQVWVVKACGHVYCGECALNRSKSKTSKKTKGKEVEKKLESPRSVPFTVCVVDGCNSKVIPKPAMFPLYL
ncbi:uncharacterized protein Z520_00697 [Fonsecaea multimorphosa CBS 102226]|uniref:RING-type domain-containing protein n=1 Tax=Fonsecaea multimorphosa CBS 102226 TaxID=1442371 RepID=A0A0D2KKK4_9EURO|nr:uncharacterized protein Z520_00697 [Fonsecaea multimorphosa CBS 102226]KIY04005.1 hypothetical protein Z520_00697 [Fonsecaea multimorphosa CBS 102226]OAL31843.1 hypothetical protein AYO22_00713 [Fonsecaea multimorphosa]